MAVIALVQPLAGVAGTEGWGDSAKKFRSWGGDRRVYCVLADLRVSNGFVLVRREEIRVAPAVGGGRVADVGAADGADFERGVDRARACADYRAGAGLAALAHEPDADDDAPGDLFTWDFVGARRRDFGGGAVRGDLHDLQHHAEIDVSAGQPGAVISELNS